MREIFPLKIVISNFRSFKSATVLFPKTVGLKFLGGINKVEPRLGANGAGKSSLWNAMYWCCYGVATQGERTSDLLSWKTEQIDVWLHLQNGEAIDNVYVIHRSGPPNRLELNGKPATQQQIDELLGLTKERFLHTVMFGQGTKLFPDLPISERGQLFDEILNLDVWTKCSEVASKRTMDIQLSISSTQKELARIEGQLSQIQTEKQIQDKIEEWENIRIIDTTNLTLQSVNWFDANKKNQESFQFLSDNWIKTRSSEIEEKATELEKLELELQSLLSDEKKFTDDLSLVEEYGILEAKIKADKKEYEEAKNRYYQLEAERKQIITPKLFWNDNKTCPTCGQHITDAKKHNHLVAIDKKEAEILADIFIIEEQKERVVLELAALELQFSKLDVTLRENQLASRDNQTNIKNIKYRITKLEYDAEKILKDIEEKNNPFDKEILKLKQSTNPYLGQIQVLKKKTNPFNQTLDNIREDRIRLENYKKEKNDLLLSYQSNLIAIEFWKTGFKRIRLFFIQQILLSLEIEIGSAIASLGLQNWKVKLSTETETKSGTTKLGVAITIQSPSTVARWEVWSGGETQRLRLGIALGLSNLIQRSAGVWYSFLVLDEPTQYLSSEGIEDLLESLQYKAETTKMQIWLCDHHALQFSGFTEIWMSIKEKDGSSINII